MSGIFVLIAIAWVVYAAIAKKANAQQQAQRQRKLNENVAEAEAETSSLHAKTQAAAHGRAAADTGTLQTANSVANAARHARRAEA